MRRVPALTIPTFNRRAFLRSAAVAAGSSLLGPIGSAADNPAAHVADRGSSIRITGLTTTICRDRVYVKIETNHGVSGWGEIKGVVPQVAAALLRAMSELLQQQNPTRIEHLWQLLYRAHRNQRGGPFMVHCISGIDMALWDITGKLWGVPVYRLLGGPTRDKIRVYPSPTAIKTAASPQPQAGSPQDIERLVDSVRRSRQRVGPNGAVMFDAHGAIPPPMLLQFAAAVQAYDLLFIEEPALPDNVQVYKRLKQQVHVPLATGERDRTLWGILPYLTEKVIDVVQPDCGYTGGISQMKKIATLAEAYHVPLAPHCTQSYLGMTASFHVAASVPLLLIHESYDQEVLGKVVRPHWNKEDGYVSLPEGVGLCVEVDEAMMAQVAAGSDTQHGWHPASNPDGSVADY